MIEGEALVSSWLQWKQDRGGKGDRRHMYKFGTKLFHWDTPLLAAVGRKREINAGNV